VAAHAAALGVTLTAGLGALAKLAALGALAKLAAPGGFGVAFVLARGLELPDAPAWVGALAGDPTALAAAVLLDLAIGDPVYPLHPIRLMGGTLTLFERGLRRIGADGYGGGIALFLLLALVWIGAISAITIALASATTPWIAWAWHVFILYSLLALGDLLRHVWRVERAVNRDDLAAAREAIGHLVGRDSDRMDGAACRRAAVESLSENLTDGYTSALFWYAFLGLPGLVLFKIASTMDSMVGYKTPRYLQFGWCGARLDDVMNYIPARATWLLIAAIAAIVPGCSARKALRIGREQHAILPGPNSGWSETATAGALQRRLVGPIWMRGTLVTDVWIGDPADPPLSTHADVIRAITFVTATGLAAALLAIGLLLP
jgi:adenosylcobinamide-phosphate synthase